MINIAQQPINYSTNFSPSFKAKTDYAKIYEEMEKITLRRDEKIIPKLSIKDRFLTKKTTQGNGFVHKAHAIKDKLKSWLDTDIAVILERFLLSDAANTLGIMLACLAAACVVIGSAILIGLQWKSD